MFGLFGGSNSKDESNKVVMTEEEQKEHARLQRLKKLQTDVPMKDESSNPMTKAASVPVQPQPD